MYLTGDTHGNIIRLLMLPDEEMTKDDLVIVLGDFGVFWDNQVFTEMLLEELGKKNFTTCFVDGNHENFNMIKQMEEVIEWNGGRAGLLIGGVIHLMRGEIYEIDGKRVGVCGGANSIDKNRRKEDVTWWAAEEVSNQDIENFIYNLGTNKQIDLMLTHDCPASMLKTIALYSGVNGAKISNSQMQLERINQIANINKWCFGHWHIDLQLDNKFECFYNGIKEV